MGIFRDAFREVKNESRKGVGKRYCSNCKKDTTHRYKNKYSDKLICDNCGKEQ